MRLYCVGEYVSRCQIRGDFRQVNEYCSVMAPFVIQAEGKGVSMSDFNAIVGGAGCAGSVAAYELAKAGKSVLLVERGNYAGAKNMTGGRIYSHALKEVFPNFEDEAPLERRVTHERISLMSPDANFTIDFSSNQMLEEGKDSYTVLRGPFDQWLASKADRKSVV